MVTESAALSAVPSFTISCSTYEPSTSGVKVGLIAVELASVAVLAPGFEVNDQL
jgi:hypothetical protein